MQYNKKIIQFFILSFKTIKGNKGMTKIRVRSRSIKKEITMKVLILAVAILCMGLATYANAERVEWTTPYTGLTELLNNNDYVYASYDKYVPKVDKFVWGYGVDAIIYEFDGSLRDVGLVAIETQGRYFQTNDTWEAMAVVKCNPFRAVMKLFGK